MKHFEIGLNAVIYAVTEDEPRVLTVLDEGLGSDSPALAWGRLDPVGDRTLELGLRRWVREQTGLELGYVEQLYTFGDRDRAPAAATEEARLFSVAYVALVREEEPPGRLATWRNVYDFLPWEDWREGRPPILDRL
nr:hypothetical protein [Pirellulales bacterium]